MEEEFSIQAGDIFLVTGLNKVSKPKQNVANKVQVPYWDDTFKKDDKN